MDLQKNVITLTTDFGTRDYFVGAVKGVMLGINRDLRITDISHEVVSHDIWGAAYLIGAVYKHFPPRTIHVVVVDPGVGSQRRPIIAVTDKHYFIAPDNGVLSFVYQDPGFSRVINIEAEHYFLPILGSTFHARDIFAPSAAWLSKGVEADKFGEVITDYARFNIPAPVMEADACAGEVIYIDKFGNAITNISYGELADSVGPEKLDSCKVQVKETVISKLSPFYAAVGRGEAGVVVNGNGVFEIFVNQGDARKNLGLKRGEKIKVLIG
jgi:S-adenosylmethionine hydrolase